MSLSYDKSKSRSDAEGGSFWASYSDLYTLMAVLFLMLYVVANLRSGTASLQGRVEYQRLAMETEDLRQQNKVYDALKAEYLATQATKSEVEVYQELMSKLSLLREKAKDEKEDLRRQAEENEEKELALNHYQQIIRNIINTNLVAKAKLISRDEVIDKKRQEIQEKEQTIAANTQEIREIRDNLQDQIEQLQQSEKARQISKANMEKQVAKLRAQSESKIAELAEQSAQAEQQLDAVTSELSKTKTNLASTEGKLAATEGKLQEETVAKAKLSAELEATKAGFEDEVERLKGEYDAKAAADKEAFTKELEGQKLSAAEKAAKEKAFADKLKGDKAALEGKLASLGDKIADTEKQLAAAEKGLADAEAEKDQYRQYVAALEEQKAGLADDLAQAKAQLADRKKVADQIKKELQKAGLKADVDGKTGEVTIAFGKEYFDTGKASLKPGMETTLKKFVPLYAKSLFKDPEIAKKIASIDLVGFASPTYAGKYVDPQSLADADRQAVNYNLDLSFQRARSIFNFMFDRNKMKFEDQQRLLGMVKVSGRSFLHEAVKGRDVKSGISIKEFCAKYDCLKEQKVIIKFNMKD